MKDVLFSIFKSAHISLQGSGLGKIKILRDLRDWIYLRVRPQKAVVVETKGVKLQIDSGSGNVLPGFMWLLFGQEYEHLESEVLQGLLKEGSNVVDIGANLGYYAVIAAKRVGPKGKVVAFEPEPVNFELLQKNIRLNNFQNITAVQAAVADKISTMKLYVDKTNSLCHRMYAVGSGDMQVDVQVTTLDDYLHAHPMRVDVIKMDIEGFEPFALRGMRKTLESNNEIKVLCEFCPDMIQKAGGSPKQFLDDLGSLGFHFSGMDEHSNTLIPEISISSIFEYCDKNPMINLLCRRS